MQCRGYGKERDESIYPTPTVYLGLQALGNRCGSRLCEGLGKMVCVQGLCTEQMLRGCHFLAFPVCKLT